MDIIGKRIKDIRKLTKRELEHEYWQDSNHPAYCIVLDDNTKLYPSMDYEGNGPGALFGRKGTKSFAIG